MQTSTRHPRVCADASRRRFLSMSALAAALILAPGSGLSGCSDHDPDGRSHEYFNAAEFAFVEAASERLIPGDANSGGARDAHVAEFIDRQLAGAYGRADRWYMQPPFEHGRDTQGYQLSHTPATLYRLAIAEIEGHCGKTFGKTFAALDATTQDRLLASIEDGSLTLAHAPGRQFFKLLLQNTQEGFLSDPIYGGNHDFTGWRLIGFPGPRYNYVEDIGQYGQRYRQPCVSIGGDRYAQQAARA